MLYQDLELLYATNQVDKIGRVTTEDKLKN